MSATSSRCTPMWSGEPRSRFILEAWVLRKDMPRQSILVTDGNFIYVSIDEQGHPQEIQRDGAPIAT